MIEALRAVPAFAGLSDEALERLAAGGTECDFPAGQVLIEANTPATGLFVLLDGRVLVHARDGDVELGAGAMLGERGVVEGGTRTARVTALTPVRCLSIARDALDRELSEAQ